jgi:glycerol uptake facilitator-like aquaporin
MKILTKSKKILILTAIYLLPVFIHAQTPGASLENLVRFLIDIFQRFLIPMFMSLGLIYVILAVIEYIQANEDSQKRAEKRQQIFWGVIALFVIISVWSLVAIVQNTFNIFSGGVLQPSTN